METATQPENSIHFETFELKLRTRELYRNGTRLKIRGHPVDVLAILLENPGELVTREELKKRLWADDTFVDFEQILNNSVGKLRDALGDKAEAPQFIETLPRLGYRFIAPVNLGESNNVLQGNTVSETSVIILRPDPPRQTQFLASSKVSRGWRISLAAITIAALIAGGLWSLRGLRSPIRVTAYRQITHDYRNKVPVATDGARLYLGFDHQPYSPAQVALSGGEVTLYPIALPSPTIRDVSPDGTTLLVTSSNNGRPSLWSIQVSGGALRNLLQDVQVRSVSSAPDGKHLAYLTTDGQIYVMRNDGSDSHKLISAPTTARKDSGLFEVGLSWSPDSSKIRFTWDYRIWEMSSSGSGLHPLLPDWRPSEWQCCGRWTVDGKFYIFLLREPLPSNTGSAIPVSQLWAIDEHPRFLRTSRSVPIQLTSGPIRWGSPIPGKDNQTVFARGVILRGELVRFDRQSRELKPFLSGISAEFVTYSPDGRFVAYVTFPDGIMWRANRDGSNPTRLTDPPLYPTLLSWSPDGRQILFIAGDSEGVRRMYILPSQGGKPQELLPSDRRVQSTPSWSPDGRKIVFDATDASDPAQRSIQILDLSDGKVSEVPGSKGIWSPRWSPDERYINGLTGILRRDHPIASLAVFDFKTQRWQVIQEGEVGYPIWSRNGKSIYFIRPVENPGVYRVRPSGGYVERVIDLKGFRYTSLFRYYMGLDPEDTPILLQDTGMDDIFAITLDER